MKATISSAVMALSVLLVDCASCQRVTPGPDAGDGGSPALDACDGAYARLSGMGCPPKAPETGSWTDACRNARANGLKFNLACFQSAADCAAAAKCE